MPAYSPAANNGGGAAPGRADIITLTGVTDTIAGGYGLRGTSATRFRLNTDNLFTRNQKGQIVSGYDAVAGRSSVQIGAAQKTATAAYPDQISGTQVTTLVYDNASLVEVPSTNASAVTYIDTNSPVYGDLRLANISGSTVTIATGDRALGIYDNANFALLTADNSSTLYNIAAASQVTYDSRTATMHGDEQDGLSQPTTRTINAPVTSYSGVTFDGTDRVTDLASLRRYNSSLIGQLAAGTITPAQYESLIQSATSTTLQPVVVSTPRITTYNAPPTTSARLFARVNASRLTTTAGSQLVGVQVADGASDAGSSLILAENGAAIINNGSIAQAGTGPGIIVDGAGTSLANEAGGVIGIGYETIDRSSGALVPGGLNGFGYAIDQVAISATNGATVVNRGIVNVSNRDVPGRAANAGKANAGIVAQSGAVATNTGTILIGGGASAAATTPGSNAGASGLVALAGGVAVNDVGGSIRIGTTFAETAADLATVTDVLSTNFANGLTARAGGAAINNGTITIGSLTQNAAGLRVGGDGATGINAGTIRIAATGLDTPTVRNAGILVTGSSIALPGLGGGADAVNAATGVIQIEGVNSVGLLVENNVANGAARAVNDGTIAVNGGLSVDRLRNYGIFVGNAASLVVQNGTVVLRGDGAIGVHARNGGTIDATANSVVDFQGANQIGYYSLGTGSTINISSATDVDTAGSTGVRVEGGATLAATGLTINVSGAGATGIVGSGASSGVTVDVVASALNVSGASATGVMIHGGANGTLDLATTIALGGTGATAAIVDGQIRSLDGTVTGPAVAGTVLGSSATVTGTSDGAVGYVARNGANLVHTGRLDLAGAGTTGILATTGANAFNGFSVTVGAGGTGIAVTGASATNGGAVTTGAGGTGILATRGATVSNAGTITAGAGGTGLRLVSASAADVVTGTNIGTIFVNGGSIANRTRGVQADGAGATANLGNNSDLGLNGNGAIGLEAVNGGTVALAGSVIPVFGAGATDQILIRVAGAGSRVTGVGGTLDASGTRSTLFRFDDGAQGSFGADALTASGAGSTAITAAGTGTSLTLAGSQLTVSGEGARGVAVLGGATGTLNAATGITIGGGGVGALVDGRAAALDGTVGAASATRLTSAATVNGAGARAIGYDVAGGGTLAHTGAVTLAGTDAIGIRVTGAGTSATHGGSIALTGTGIGTVVAGGGSFANQGAITVAVGTGVLIDGAGSTFTGTGSQPVSVSTGVAAVRLVNGGALNGGGSFTAGGTANGIQLDAGAGALTLGGGTVTVTGSGNGIENGSGSTAVLLNGTTINANGTGAGIHTAAALQPASIATINAAGANSTGIAFSGPGGTTIANGATFGSGLRIVASGAGATGLRLATTGAVTLAGQVNVTNAAGGSALVGGPAASIANTGSLVSASTTTPVVDLTGGTRAFASSGTISAASAGGTAIAGGNNGQSVTISGGAITGAILLGSGADTFVMTGGTLTGAFNAGAGNDSVTFRGLADANLANTTVIAGGGVAGGADVLTFDNSRVTGTRRLAGFNTVSLVNNAALTADGDLVLAGGTLTIDGTSTYLAGNGVRSVIRAATGSAGVVNAGTIDLTNGASGVGDTLTVRGTYAGQGGSLLLNANNTTADRLIIDGGSVTGTTTIRLSASGLGAATTGDGIELVSAINGGTTTARTGGTGFTLAGGSITAGAFEYRLFASNAAGTSESFFLRTATNSGVPTFRSEVPLLAAVPQQLREGELAMIGTYHKRRGDPSGTAATGFDAPDRLWGRIIAADGRTRQGGDARPEANQSLFGIQVGIDAVRYGTANGTHSAGVYLGHTDGKARIDGFAGGVDGVRVGKLDPKATYAGAYWTFTGNAGFYIDAVVQGSWFNGDADPLTGSRLKIDGHGLLGSLEAGYAVRLSPAWSLEPQAQLIVQDLSIDGVDLGGVAVDHRSPRQFTGRLGVRAKGTYDLGGTTVQPYLRANLWKGFKSTDRVSFANAVATTVVATPTSSLWGEAAGGLTADLSSRVAIYGEIGHRFTLDHDQGAVGHNTAGSIGVRFGF